jgi:aspartate kinase
LTCCRARSKASEFDRPSLTYFARSSASWLPAVLLAAALKAKRCELVKDVPGYFSSDLRENKKARHFAGPAYQSAIAMARSGCPVVQREALEAAERADLALVIRSIASDRTCTVVSREGAETLASTG